jgi:hypothetical protein
MEEGAVVVPPMLAGRRAWDDGYLLMSYKICAIMLK